jgi:hypothetical protein
MTRRRQPDANNDSLIEEVLARLDHITTLHMSPAPTPPAQEKRSGESYSIPQILSGLFIILSLVGSLSGVWVNLNNQITSQKVTYDLTIEQMKKDLDVQKEKDKDADKSLADTKVEIATSFKELMQHVEQLDNSINQIYNRVNK